MNWHITDIIKSIATQGLHEGNAVQALFLLLVAVMILFIVFELIVESMHALERLKQPHWQVMVVKLSGNRNIRSLGTVRAFDAEDAIQEFCRSKGYRDTSMYMHDHIGSDEDLVATPGGGIPDPISRAEMAKLKINLSSAYGRFEQ